MPGPDPQGLTAIVIEAVAKTGKRGLLPAPAAVGLERNAHLITYTSLWERRMTGCSLGWRRGGNDGGIAPRRQAMTIFRLTPAEIANRLLRYDPDSTCRIGVVVLRPTQRPQA